MVRSTFEEWERGDYSSIEWAHPEIEYEVASTLTLDEALAAAGVSR